MVGFVHHFTCQFPAQADVVTSFSFWAGGNVLFLTVALLAEPAPTTFGNIIGAMVFNAIYVRLIKNEIDGKVSTALVFKAFYNVYFRHRGIPTELRLSLTDWGLWKYSMGGYSHLKIAELHKELGTKSLADSMTDFKVMSSAFSRITSALIPSRPLKTFIPHKQTRGKAIFTNTSCELRDFPPIFSIPRIAFYWTILICSEKSRHAFLRRTIGPIFSSASMTVFEHTMKRYSSDLIQAVRRDANDNDGVVDMNDWFNRFSFDVSLPFSSSNDSGCWRAFIWGRVWCDEWRRATFHHQSIQQVYQSPSIVHVHSMACTVHA